MQTVDLLLYLLLYFFNLYFFLSNVFSRCTFSSPSFFRRFLLSIFFVLFLMVASYNHQQIRSNNTYVSVFDNNIAIFSYLPSAAIYSEYKTFRYSARSIIHMINYDKFKKNFNLFFMKY